MSATSRRTRSSVLIPVVLSVLSLAAARNAAAQEVSEAAANTVGQQLVSAFTADSPFTPDAPDHLWFDNQDGTYLFLHFNGPFDEATGLMFTGWAVEGRWCEEDRPTPEFTHFHRTARVGAWGAGHGGGTAGEPGYWLKHIAVERMEMPAMMGMPARTIEPGADGMFMPTQPPSCGG